MEQKFANLAVQELDAVHRMAFHLSRQADLTAELVQETYLRAFKAKGRFELREGGIRPWLFKILHNVFYTILSKQQREPTAGGEVLNEVAANEESSCCDVESLNWEQVDQRLKWAIDELDPRYREVLLLWAVEGLKYREIGEVLGVPLGTVMSRLYRARAILSKQLAPMAREKGITQESSRVLV